MGTRTLTTRQKAPFHNCNAVHMATTTIKLDSTFRLPFGRRSTAYQDYMTGRGMVNIKQLGVHCSGLQRDSLGDPLFATRGQWRPLQRQR